jgi:hypothetical protein
MLRMVIWSPEGCRNIDLGSPTVACSSSPNKDAEEEGRGRKSLEEEDKMETMVRISFVQLWDCEASMERERGGSSG